MEYFTTIGIDVSDRKSKICVMQKMLNGERKILFETTCTTSHAGFESVLAKYDRSIPVIFETGTHCRWMDKFFRELGFKTIVANPNLIPSITKSNKKNDRNDARELARLGIADMEMLHPVLLREDIYQKMLCLHSARKMLMKQRTSIINMIRGFAKTRGVRIECTSTEKFHELDKSNFTPELEDIIWPCIEELRSTNENIKKYDEKIAALAKEPQFKKMVERVCEVYGVGIIGATAFIAAIGGRPERFARSRDVGAYLGLVPKQDQSGDTDKQLHITHAGSSFVRSVLVECAGVVMQSNAKRTDIKLKGLRIAMSGGKMARNKAKVAVARCLATTMIALLNNPEREYVLLSKDGEAGFKLYDAEMENRTMKKSAKKDAKVA